MASLLAAAKTAFVEAARIGSIIERREVVSLAMPSWLDLSQAPEVPLKLVYVEDFYTTGLDGPPHDSSSRFHRFLLSVGDSGKVHDGHNTGGSYGFGKSAFSSNSGIRTILPTAVIGVKTTHRTPAFSVAATFDRTASAGVNSTEGHGSVVAETPTGPERKLSTPLRTKWLTLSRCNSASDCALSTSSERLFSSLIRR